MQKLGAEKEMRYKYQKLGSGEFLAPLKLFSRPQHLNWSICLSEKHGCKIFFCLADCYL